MRIYDIIRKYARGGAKSLARGLNERVCQPLESHNRGAAKVDIVEDGIGHAVETHLKIAPSRIDLETTIKTCENGGGDCGGCNASSTSQSLSLDASLIGTDGDMTIGEELSEVYIHAIGHETLSETDFWSDIHNVDGVEIVDKLDIVRNTCIETENPIGDALDRIDWGHLQIDPMTRRICDSCMAAIIGRETERHLGLDNTAGDRKIAQTARTIATERGPAAVLIVVNHAEIVVGRGRKKEQTVCPDAETTIAQACYGVGLEVVIETGHIVDDDKIITSSLVFAKVYNHQ